MIPRTAFIDSLTLTAAALVQLRPLDAAVVECGTWRGGMAAAMMALGGGSRRYHFFDSFEGLPPAQAIDGGSAIAWQKNPGGAWYFDNCSASEADFRATLARTQVSLDRVSIHRGFFESTVPSAVTGPIAVLRLDGDWYESTWICLEHLFPRVISGGLVLIDDYGTWDGCTRAVHDYLSKHSRPEPIERFGRSATVFIRKREAESGS